MERSKVALLPEAKMHVNMRVNMHVNMHVKRSVKRSVGVSLWLGAVVGEREDGDVHLRAPGGDVDHHATAAAQVGQAAHGETDVVQASHGGLFIQEAHGLVPNGRGEEDHVRLWDVEGLSAFTSK